MKQQIKTFVRALSTVSGLKKQGYFIPYAHAASVPAPPPAYAPIEALFESRRQAFRSVLDRIEVEAGALTAACKGPLNGHWNGGYFGAVDTAAAFVLAREAQPKRILEVGSGSSTHVMASAFRDAADCPDIRCIDPAPRKAILNRPGFTGEFFVQNLSDFIKVVHACIEGVLHFLRRPVTDSAV